LRLGLPLAVHGVAVAMLVSVDRLVIGAVLGLAATGRYTVAYAVGGLGVALITAFNQAWIPLMLGTSAHERWPVLEATTRTLHVIAVAVAAALALLGPAGLALAAPRSYHLAQLIPVAAIIAGAALPYATCGTYFQVLFLSGRTRVMSYAAPAAVVAGVLLDLALLGPAKLVGAAVATLASYALLALLVAARARRVVALGRAGRDAAIGWLAAAPPVAAGALLPANGVGWAMRLTALALVLGVAWRVLRRKSNRPYTAGTADEHSAR
jgi:O-antigen/teichoic acid export membrane protein